MSRNVIKMQVEELLEYRITDVQFTEAMKLAEQKQKCIYQQENRESVLQHWYLVKLTEEYVRSLALSKFTMDLCSTLHDMEKEHSVKNQSAPTDKNIITVPEEEGKRNFAELCIR